MWASRDGTNWVALVNRLAPEPKWGRAIDFANYLPKSVVAGEEVWVRAELLVEGKGTMVSPAQLGRAEGKRTAPVFELRAQWAD